MADSLVDWMMTIDAAGALETIAQVGDQAKATLDGIDERAKDLDLAAGIGSSTRGVLDSFRQIDVSLSNLGRKAGSLGVGLDTGDAEDALARLASTAGKGVPPVTMGGQFAFGFGKAQDAPNWVPSTRRPVWQDEPAATPGVPGRAGATAAKPLGQERCPCPFDDALVKASAGLLANFQALNRVLPSTVRNLGGTPSPQPQGQAGQGQQPEPTQSPAPVQQSTYATAETTRQNMMAALAALGVSGYAVRSMTQAGFAGTGEEAVSQHYNLMLARQFAGIAAPLKMENVGRIAELTDWFRKLNGEQQESIRNIAIFATSMTTLGVVLPRVTAGLRAMTTAQVAANAAAAASSTFSGVSTGRGLTGAASMAGSSVGAAFGPVGMAAAVGVSLLASTREGRDALVDVAKAFEPAIKALMDVVREMRPTVRVMANGVRDLSEKVRDINASTGGSLEFLAGLARHPATVALDHGASVRRMLFNDPDLQTEDGRVKAQQRQWDNWFGGQGRLARWFSAPEGLRNFLGGERPGTPSRPTPRSDVTGMPGGFESIDRTWERITEAATRVDLQQQTVNELQQANSTLQAIQQGLNPTTGFFGFEKWKPPAVVD